MLSKVIYRFTSRALFEDNIYQQIQNYILVLQVLKIVTITICGFLKQNLSRTLLSRRHY